MGDTEQLDQDVTIACRSCNNQMSVTSKNCPHCGSRAISTYESVGIALVGLATTVATGLTGLWPITAIGFLTLVAGVGLYWNRRQKIQQATP